MTLSSKKVVVLGGGSGMGFAIARQAIEAGATVVIVGRTEAKLASAIKALGTAASYKVFDLADEEAVKAAFAAIGPIDHLVSTAAHLTFTPVADVTTAQVHDMLGSKFWGPLYAAKYAAPQLAKNGSITFLSGLAAYRPAPGATIVAALNAALEGMAMGLALELKPVRVNVVSPGVIDTPTWAFLSDEDRKGLFATVAAQLPVGRVGEADDVAEAVLAVIRNGFINATVINVDGGGRIV